MGTRARTVLAELTAGLRSNALMAVATVVTVAVSLTLGGAALLAQRQADLVARAFYAQVEVSVFLERGATVDQIADLRADLDGDPLVAEATFLSQQDAYEEWRELYDDDPSLTEFVDPGVLPASFSLALEDPRRYAEVSDRYGAHPAVDTVVDQREYLDGFFDLMGRFTEAVFWTSVLQLVGGVALIATIVRLSVYARREQIGIMRLVGASNAYIRLPFVLEGVLTGLVGALGAVVVLFAGTGWVVGQARDVTTGLLTFFPLIDLGDVAAIAPLLVVAGGGVAAIASLLSLWLTADV